MVAFSNDAAVRRIAWIGVVALLAFVACAIAMSTGATAGIDDLVLRWMHAQAAPPLDALAWWLARIGYGYGVLPFDALLVLALLMLHRRRDAMFAALALGPSLLLNTALKLTFARPRPVLDWPAAEVQHTFSFPSGHAMATATLAAVLVLLAWRGQGGLARWRWPVAALAAGFSSLVGVSRVYVGVHHPVDVIAGWAMGIAWPALAWRAVAVRRAPGGPAPGSPSSAA